MTHEKESVTHSKSCWLLTSKCKWTAHIALTSEADDRLLLLLVRGKSQASAVSNS